MKPPLHWAAAGLGWAIFGSVTVLIDWLILAGLMLRVISMGYEFLYVLLAILAFGLGTAFVGRCLGLTLPLDARAGRAWAVIALALDGSGLFCGIATFVLALCRVYLGEVAGIGAALFSLGGLVLGRVAFAFYVRSLAKYIGEERLGSGAVLGFWHAVAVFGGLVLSGWLVSSVGSREFVYLAWVVIATLLLLHWTWSHVRLLAAVRTAALSYFPPPPDADDDPDREYRERYEADLRDGRVRDD